MMKIWSNVLKCNGKELLKYSAISKGFARNFKSIPKVINNPSEGDKDTAFEQPENLKNLNINTFKTPKFEQFNEEPAFKEEKRGTKNKKFEDIEGYLGNDEPQQQFSRKKDRRKNFDDNEERPERFDRKRNQRDFGSEGGYENKKYQRRDREWNGNRNSDERNNNADRYENRRDNRENRYSGDRNNNNKEFDRSFNKRRDRDFNEGDRDFKGNRGFRDDNRRGNRDRNDSFEGRNRSANFERGPRRNEEQTDFYGNRNKSRYEDRERPAKSNQKDRKFVNPDRNVMDSDEEMDSFKPKNISELKNRQKEVYKHSKKFNLNQKM
jgi:hypothetical protein